LAIVNVVEYVGREYDGVGHMHGYRWSHGSLENSITKEK